MSKGNPRTTPPQKPGRLLNLADTASTAPPFDQKPEAVSRRQRGERINAPTAEMRGAPPTDWGKISVWMTAGAFVIGILTTVIWNYSEMVNSIRSLNNDVSDLKKRADDLFKSTVITDARLTSLEQHAHPEPSPRSDIQTPATGSLNAHNTSSIDGSQREQ